MKNIQTLIQKKIFSNFGLHDFSSESEIDNTIIISSLYDQFSSAIWSGISGINGLAGEKTKKEWRYAIELGMKFKKFLQTAYSRDKDNPYTLVLSDDIMVDNIGFPKGMSLFKAYGRYRAIMDEIFSESHKKNIMPLLETMSAFKELSAIGKMKKINLFFSTKIEDLVGISSRGIESCQSVFQDDGSYNHDDEHLPTLAGAILSRYIGVIYTTMGQDYLGRGSKMMHRRFVKVVYNVDTDQPYIFLESMYPRHSSLVEGEMLDALSRHSKIQVISTGDLTKKFYFKDDEGIANHHKPYHDTCLSDPTEKLINEAKNSVLDYSEYSPFMILLKRDPEALLNILDDFPSLEYHFALAQLLPDRYLKRFSEMEKNLKVLLVLAKRKNEYSFFKNIFNNNPNVIKLIYKDLPDNVKLFIINSANSNEVSEEILKEELSRHTSDDLLLSAFNKAPSNVGRKYFNLLPENIKNLIL